MNIKIGYLYYDLMNLYGEIGNIKALTYHLNEQGIKTEIKYLSLEDKINVKDLDLIYIGSGTEDNRKLVFDNLKKYKKDIEKAIEDNKFFLVTGNATTLFSKNYLDIFDFDVEESPRIVKEVITKFQYTNKDIYGLYNYSDDVNYNGINNLFKDDGISYKNFYATYLIGPLLVRNPEFTKYFVKELIKSKDKKFKFKKFNTYIDEKAYDEYITFKKNKKTIK